MTSLTTSRILPGERLGDEQQRKVVEEFHRQGFALVPGILTTDEVHAIREITDYCIDTGEGRARTNSESIMGVSVLRYTQSIDRLFCDMLIREPFPSLAEAILGPNCGFVGQNVIRSDPGTGISRWHIDDILEFPLPEEMPRHDARMKMPVFWFSFQIVLSDIDSVENGPTQIVPGSHYSGRGVPSQDESKLIFEGQGPVSVLARPGDIYLFNHQTWHRGSPNKSNQKRYLMQNQYCKAWGLSRFSNPNNNCNLSNEELKGAPERLLELLRRK